MNITINDAPIDIETEDMSTEQLIEFLLEKASENGTKITTYLKINDMEYIAEDVDAYGKIDLNEIENIEMRSAYPLDIARRGLSEGAEKLNEILDILVDISKMIRLGKEDRLKGLENFAKILEILSWLMNILKNVEPILKVDFNTFRVNGLTLKEMLEDINSVLKEIQESQEEKDFENIADLIEYELVERLIKVYKTFRKLEEESKKG